MEKPWLRSLLYLDRALRGPHLVVCMNRVGGIPKVPALDLGRPMVESFALTKRSKQHSARARRPKISRNMWNSGDSDVPNDEPSLEDRKRKGYRLGEIEQLNTRQRSQEGQSGEFPTKRKTRSMVSLRVGNEGWEPQARNPRRFTLWTEAVQHFAKTAPKS